jgi:hypothetical protein
MAETAEPPGDQPVNENRPPTAENGATPESGEKQRHPSVNYEESDVRFRGLLIFAIAFVLLGAGIIAGIDAFFRSDTARVATRRESEFPLAEHPSTALPVGPRLEQVDRLAGISSENVYLRQLAREDQLDHYGETGEKGFVHIPISRAMQSLAGHLPVRKPPQGPAKDNGLVDFGAPNSGRLFRGSPQ